MAIPGRSFMTRGFEEPAFSADEQTYFSELARSARGDILAMTTLAGSGHPGGSLSSLDVFLVLWSCAQITPATVDDPARDRIVISHGHTAPAVYAALGRCGFFEPVQAICAFRRVNSPFEGHADPKVPGVEWACGNLGQGLSAACGFALSSRLMGVPYSVYCVMGDGEQQKGQIAEARRFASKYALDNLVAIIDCNNLQAMGSVAETMPQHLAAEWELAGWRVLNVDGHNHVDIHKALAIAKHTTGRPTVILARTVMGKGVVIAEDRYEYHGTILSRDQCEAALLDLGLSRDHISPTKPDSTAFVRSDECKAVENSVHRGKALTYIAATACRGAFGKALENIAFCNPDVPIAVFDCDLSASVQTNEFAQVRPDGFFQCGIQEHSTATIAGAASKNGVLSFFADFGVFGIDETYNQLRLNDINKSSLKLVCTHCGLDVGEDGKTHQCIDYIGLAANLYGVKLIVPADANQTDRAVRYMASTPGLFLLAVGRSKLPIIVRHDGEPLYSDDYEFEYGRADWVRTGSDGTIITIGNMVHKAVEVSRRLVEADMQIGVLNLSCPLDLDEERLKEAAGTGFVVTYEDHNARTGIGCLIGSYLAEHDWDCRFLRLGVSKYGVSGNPEDNYRLQGLDVDSVTKTIQQRLLGEGV